MHKVQAKGILSSQNGMNVYRGCQHGCIYCDARSTCYQMNHVFEDIEVKENAPVLLERALRSKRKKCMIATGAMSDPYIPLEKELLKEINRKAKCVVQMTLTTYDEALCRILEPNVCTTKRRAEVLEILRQEGIPTMVWMTPILPFINDTEENIEGLLRQCIQVQTKGIITFGMGFTLRQGDREYYYRKLDQHFPGLKQRYIRDYGNAYELPSPRQGQLMGLFRDTCREHGIWCDPNQCFAYLHEFEEKGGYEQLSLF